MRSFVPEWTNAGLGDGQVPQKQLTLELPIKKPNVAVPVIELFLK